MAGELQVPFRRTGKVVVGFNDHDRENLLKYKAVGEQNGVRGMRMIDKEELNRLDSSAGGEFAMYVPDSGILDPMQYTIALAENACQNGVEFYFNSRVVAVAYFIDGFTKDEVLLKIFQIWESMKPEDMPEDAHGFSITGIKLA